MSEDNCPGRPGDLVVFIRNNGLYKHYAVNVGDGYIIHVTSVSDDRVGSSDLGCCSTRSNIAVIKKQKYSDFAKPGDNVKVKKGSWRGKPPLPAEEIIERAHSKIGERDYSVLWNNCEHFTRWCRYDEKASDQADSLIIMGAVVAAGSLALGLYALMMSSSKKDNCHTSRKRGNEHDPKQ